MRGALARLALVAALWPAIAPAEGVPEPAGFGGEPYRSPVPDALQGATTVGTEEALRLWTDGEVAFIDVMPHEDRPADLPEGTIWRDRPRDSIPGATWLPNTGYESLPGIDEAYLKAGLAEATGGDPARPVLFFCREECWMSWNAAKRAIGYGYASVYWYPLGSDGWVAAGQPTERATPWPRP